MTVYYYSNEKNEYLTRELGWIWKKLQELDIHLENSSISSVHVLCVGQDPKELERFVNLPYKSIWVLLYADETLDPSINRLVVSMDSVRGVIRHYPCPANNFFNRLILLVRSIWLSKVEFGEILSLKFLSSSFSAFIYMKRMNSTFKLHQKFSKDIIYLPIGYTNLFARSIVTFVSHHSELGIDENISLLQMSETLNRNFEKKIIFCFSGQKGKFWRTKAIEDFRRWNTSNSNFAIKINVRKGFSGTEGANGVTESVGLNYVQELLASRFVLCPPGNYSIYTFRFLESIVSGALPLYCYPCPSDPISSYTVLRSSITIFCDWAETLSKAVSWSDLQHARYRKELIRGFEMIFEEVNRKISHDIWT